MIIMKNLNSYYVDREGKQIAIIRPINEIINDYTLSDNAKNREKNPRLFLNKTASVEKYDSVNIGDEITYTISIKNYSKQDYKKIASSIYKNEDIYFIGRGIDIYSCYEGSLKLKEISYIHSECFASGELKHGPIALISKNIPVIALLSEFSVSEKTINNI